MNLITTRDMYTDENEIVFSYAVISVFILFFYCYEVIKTI